MKVITKDGIAMVKFKESCNCFSMKSTDVMWHKDLESMFFHFGLNVLHTIKKEDGYQTYLLKDKVQSGFTGVVNLLHSTTVKSWGNS